MLLAVLLSTLLLAGLAQAAEETAAVPATAPAVAEASATADASPAEGAESTYERPCMVASPFRAWKQRAVDIGVFCGLLVIGTWVVLSRRRRVWFFGLMLVSVAYLGFFRHGCICSVGAIGNVAQALSMETRAALKLSPPLGAETIAPPPETALQASPEPPAEDNALREPACQSCRNGVLSVEAVAFFILPLLVALFFGRIFCGTTCPLGALQDLLARRPVRLPSWLDRPLRLGPWLMLSYALVSAWVWLGLPICQLDPFIPLFRLAERSPLAWGCTGGVLLLCVFVTRPYCRWVCPYGALLNLMSRLTIRPRKLDAAACMHCGRCLKVCPVDAITLPPSGAPGVPMLDAAACIQCGRCNRACGKHAIHWHAKASRDAKRKYSTHTHHPQH